ncbi:MAG: hypothetical protein K9J37_11640 [Saprospiraceae bacterium]|nr:hypothetical protein [Saprospiraceae bacterium]MCF8250559.1 hypothetical protein [Saprospiraceae bacterium]MCF8279699.1 hypothetical protein [Bacteroidales bacterium]MCF8312485.1 hypothetical protein [Saprospiraceae bacterium]MCF8440698.1 hypothetical protein [Saprospiraceae bacterium]
MLWLLALILLPLVLLLWLPLELEIDTSHALYRVRWLGIFGFRGVPSDEGWRWFFKVFFWEKEWKPGGGQSLLPKKKRPRKPKRVPSARKVWSLVKNLFRAIKVKRIRVNWDTGDYVRNAQLYPLFHSLSKRKRQLNINFMGKEELEILLQTRLWHIAGAFLRSFI